MVLNLGSLKAQKKCKFDYEKKDEITGEIKKGNTTPIYTSPLSPDYWYLGLNRIGNSYYIGILLQLSGEMNVNLKEIHLC